MFFSKYAALSLALAMTTTVMTQVNAAGECCVDEACTVCNVPLNQGDGSTGKGDFASCKSEGYPAFLLPNMGNLNGCMKTSEPKLHYCCPSRVPEEEWGPNPNIFLELFDGCQNCDSRFTEEECLGSDLPWTYDAYDTRTCTLFGNPGGFMDPHIKTWTGQWFDYQGECDLVLLHLDNFEGTGVPLDIHIRTTIRADFSFISTAVLRIGEDSLEVSGWGLYALNGVQSAELLRRERGGDLAGYHVDHIKINKKRHNFEISTGSNDEKIVIETFKDIVSVKINHGSLKHYNGVQGLMGNSEGKLLARDGVTEISDLNAFGQEWQVTAEEPMLFTTARAPQAANNEKCSLPDANAVKVQRRLGESIAREAAEKACAQYKGFNFEHCVYDVMASGDLEMADAGAY